MEPTSLINLPGYECQLGEDGLAHSRLKLESVANDLLSSSNNDSVTLKNVQQIPCQSHEETINYRSTCTFQMIKVESNTSSDDRTDLCFAMRSAKMAKALNGDYFPIATLRIQHAMKLVAKYLNEKKDVSASDKLDDGPFQFNQLRTNLSSTSFVSSWNNDLDCIVTFNYCRPIYINEATKLNIIFEANEFCSKCNITTLILRSKKVKEVVGRSPPYIDDILHIDLKGSKIRVDLGRGKDDCPSIVPVLYTKPEDAFQHPNGNTMLQALEWMLNKLKTIGGECRGNKPFNLLEMYCGAGAHTMPISKIDVFDAIVAVELDQRLVDACKENCIRNGCNEANTLKTEGSDRIPKLTPVYVFSGDAGEWASKSLSRRQKEKMELESEMNNLPTTKIRWQHETFQVLLVDPPRAGLDIQVCNLAINGSFDHIIYVSCGRHALLKDLKVLSEAFDILDCTLTDLFPRTDSVETLVHLRRKLPD